MTPGTGPAGHDGQLLSPGGATEAAGPQPRLRPRTRLRERLAAVTGTGAAASAALALLVLGCVFVAVAGPRQSLALRTRALQSTLAGLPPLNRSVIAQTGYGDFAAALQSPTSALVLRHARTQLATELTRANLPLAPLSTDWTSLTSAYDFVSGAARSAYNGENAPKLEVIYRDELARHTRLVTGRMPGAGHGRVLEIAVTRATARRFGLRPSSVLTTPAKTRLEVTGILVPRDPSSAFWTADPNAAVPTPPVPARNAIPSWYGAAFASGAEVTAMTQRLDLFNGSLEWDFPLRLQSLTADQAGPLQARLKRVGLRAGALFLGPQVNVAVSSPVSLDLATYLTTDAALATLLGLLFVSLTVIGLVVVLLGVQLLAERRQAEFTLMRARGAARWQLAVLALRGGAVAAGPAALAGAALAVAVTPGPPAPLAWWLAGVTVGCALAGPALLAAWRPDALTTSSGADHGTYGAAGGGRRTLRPARPGRARRTARAVTARRWVVEGTAVALAVGGLAELRSRGLPADGPDLFLSTAPVLIAIPAAVLVLRLAPAALRGLLRLASARPGVTAFVALARAARAALGATLPAFALVLALTVVAFGFLIRGAVQRGEVAQSWRVNGADAVVSLTRVPDGVTPAEQRVIAAVPGARLTVAASVTTASPGSGPPVDVVIADPARYAALTATTPYPPLPGAARLARLARPASQAAGQATAGTAAPVLASPSVAARLGRGPASLQTALGTVSVRVAGTLPSTPAVPGSAGFVILPDWAAARLAPHPPSELLISGDSVSRPALAAAIRRAAPQATVAYRADVLAGLAGAPLPHGAYVAFAEGSVAAAGFCVLVMLLSLLLAARSRQLTLARLATMGLGPGQARRLVVAEALPPVLAAAVAGVACALALAPLLAPELDLSAFTGSAAAVPVSISLAALVIPAAALVALAAATLAAQAALASRRSPASALRITS
jgi:putative ABC transport system permease protein